MLLEVAHPQCRVASRSDLKEDDTALSALPDNDAESDESLGDSRKRLSGCGMF